MARGGKREGAGRPKGLNQYGESTKPIRIPLSYVDAVKDLITGKAKLQSKPSNDESFAIPYYGGKVAAGMPAPADDYIEEALDLNQHLVKDPKSSFIVRAIGQSMINAGIFDGDMLIVDRTIPALNGKIVVAAIDGELTVKRIQRKDSKLLFLPENDDFSPIDATHSQSVVIWGVVTNVIHQV